MTSQGQNSFQSVPAVKSPDLLRERAEESLKKKSGALQKDKNIDSLSADEMRKILHELQVHQIELEMQNEELCRIHAELDESRLRYFDLYDLAPVGYCSISAKGIILQANLTAANAWNIDRGELIQQPLSRFILKEDQDLFYRLRHQLLTTSQPQSCELRIFPRDGKIYWAHISASTIKNDDGQFVIHIAITDISERKIAEAAQQEALVRLQKIASRLPGVVYQYRRHPDGTSSLPYASEGLQEMLHITPEAAKKDASLIFSTIHPDDREGLTASALLSAKELTPWNYEFRLKLDGKYRWFSGNSIPERESDSSTLWHGFITDVTARKEAEVELQKTSALLEESQAVARMGNWSFDPATGKSHWSKQLFAMYGVDESCEVPDFNDLLKEYYPDDAIVLSALVQKALTDGTPYTLVRRLQRPGIGLRYLRGEGRARRDEQGKIIGLYGTLIDVTAEVEREEALKAARQQAETANRAKSEFLANMSHEIRTPLTAILGFADVIRDEANLENAPPKKLEAIDTITNAGQHLLAIINDILDLSKIEADKTSIERIETPLVALFGEIVSLLIHKAKGKGVSLKTVLASPIPDRIMSDPTRLRQILMNLAGNAIKFTEAGQVTITASTESCDGVDRLLIDVEDSGIGMTSDQTNRLFEAFGQADGTVSRIHGGTGLGLTISRRLAILMGGNVILLRTQLGIGSCFRLSLPMEPAAGATMVERFDEKLALRTSEPVPIAITLEGSILLAEDGLDNQRLITFHLRKAGARVDVAGNGKVALEMIAKHAEDGNPYDLLITDIQMPEIDGYTLTRTLRDQGNNLPIIALTAHALAEDRQRCFDAGCNDYDSKPINKASLLVKCAKWIATSIDP